MTAHPAQFALAIDLEGKGGDPVPYTEWVESELREDGLGRWVLAGNIAFPAPSVAMYRRDWAVLLIRCPALRLGDEKPYACGPTGNMHCRPGDTINFMSGAVTLAIGPVDGDIERAARYLCDGVNHSAVYDTLPDGPAVMGLLDTKADWRLLAEGMFRVVDA